MRATRGMQSNYGGSTRRSMATGTFESWPFEPRTWGHNSGSLGQLDNMYEHFTIFPPKGSDPRVVWNKIKNYSDLVSTIIWEIFQGCSQPDIRQKARFKGNPINKSKVYLGTMIRSLGLLIEVAQSKIHHKYLLHRTRKRITRTRDYIKGVSTESAL
jgi:hypothetical protein